jgi:hypothetical protein
LPFASNQEERAKKWKVKKSSARWRIPNGDFFALHLFAMFFRFSGRSCIEAQLRTRKSSCGSRHFLDASPWLYVSIRSHVRLESLTYCVSGFPA